MLNRQVITLILFLITFIDDGYSDKIGDYCVVKYTYEKGSCESFNDCRTAVKDIKNGFNTTYCKGFDSSGAILVCCRESSPNQDVVDLKLGEDSVPKKKRISDKKCEEYSKVLQGTVRFQTLTPEPVRLELKDPICKYVGIGLIVGGMEAQIEEFPHMAAIGFQGYEDGYQFLCSGTLISPKFVLTAGHCNQSTAAPKENRQPIVVRLGDHNLDPSVDDGAKPIEIRIDKIHMHPEYKPPVVYNDIALLELEKEVTISSNIRPACLWTEDGVGNYLRGYATGWGVTDVLHPRPSDILMKVLLPFQDSNKCDDLLLKFLGRNWAGFTSTQICAGDLEGKHDTCQGDSGGPLQVMSRDNKCVFHVLGVTSVGRGCGEKNHPAMYTRVSSYLDWIENIVWPNG